MKECTKCGWGFPEEEIVNRTKICVYCFNAHMRQSVFFMGKE